MTNNSDACVCFLSSYTWRRQTNVQKPYICTRFVHNFSYMMNIKNFKRRQNLLHLVIIVTIYFCFWFSYSFDLIRLRFMTDASWFVDWGFSFYYVWTIGGSQSTWLLFIWREMFDYKHRDSKQDKHRDILLK